MTIIILCQQCSNRKGRTPLHIAAKANQINVVRFLFSKGIKNINVTDHNNYTPLMDAITSKSDPHLVQVLIDNGAFLNREKIVDEIILKCVIEDEIEVLKLFHMAKYDWNVRFDTYYLDYMLSSMNCGLSDVNKESFV